MSENPYFAVRKQWGFRITETGKKLAVSGMNNGDINHALSQHQLHDTAMFMWT